MTVAFLFSPQGSQQVGMGRELAAASAAARDVFRAADDALGWSVSRLCWEGPAERLDDTRWTQPALLATSVACLTALRDAAGVRASLVAGHSVGEYAALVAAGALALDDALRLVARRGELMAAQGTSGGMAAVLGLDRETVAAVVDRVARPTELVVANHNAPDQVVISGTIDALALAEPQLHDSGARRVVRLRVSGAFHSPLMAPVADELAAAFEEVEWRDADPPLVSNVTAEPVSDAATLRNLLAEQVRSPVEWVRCVQRMAAHGIDTVVECGPGSALTGMVRRIAPAIRTLNVSDPATLTSAVTALAGAAAPVAAGRGG